jgi:photosystem II stability/assembly factor-like uncharacterized protein
MLSGLRYRNGGTATMTSTPPPASAALPGANDVIAADGTNGGSGAGASGQPGGAVLLAAADSGIWRSADSGMTWHRVLSGIQAWSVTRVSGGGFAALGVTPGPNAPGLTAGVTLPELATSANGVSWQLARVPEPTDRSLPEGSLFGYGYRLLLGGTGAGATGVAVPDPGALWAGLEPAYRTTDGGRHWTPLTLPASRGSSAGGGAVAVSGGAAMLADGRTMFVTGIGTGPRTGCAGAVYKSADGGATWALLSGSCQRYPLQDVQFTSDLDGFAVGGIVPKFGGGQVVEATTDGGATWQVRWHTRSGMTGGGPAPTAGFVRIDMLGGGSELGWAVAGGCTTGQNGPCPGAVYVTADGGTNWKAAYQQALAVAGTGGGSAVAVTNRMSAVTTDGGRNWAEQTRPETNGTQIFAGTGGSQLWTTTTATDISADGGAHWSPVPAFPAPLAAEFGALTWQAAPSALFGYFASGSQAWASGDGGHTWAASTVPGSSGRSMLLTAALGTGDTAYAVTGPGSDCLSGQAIKKIQQIKHGWKPTSGASVLYSSSDGGAHWNGAGRALPFGVQVLAAMAASGSRVAIIDACGRLQLSTDAGAHWTAQSLGTSAICTVSLLGSEAWLWCLADNGTWSLHSADGGATWLAYRMPGLAGQAQGIFATGSDNAVLPIGGALWRTSDGGRSWLESWPLG